MFHRPPQNLRAMALQNLVQTIHFAQPSVAFAIKDRWKDEYVRDRREPTLISYRSNDAKAMHETDWDRLYREERKKVAAEGAQRGLY